MTWTAPRNEKPLIVAEGTAAYPVGLLVGNTMLEVGPASRTLPIADSVVVSTANTEFEPVSNVAKMFREGETTIKPGDVPALMGATRAIVSFVPSINTSLPWRRVELTSCDARTRSFRPLGGFFGWLLPPQERKLRADHTPTTQTRMRLFKREAPNNMKKEDLVAKWWIITDPVLLLMTAGRE